MIQDAALNPCPYMRNALERLARGERGCLWLWYARLHALRCPRCRRALEALRRYFDELVRPMPAGSDAIDWERLERTLDGIEQSRNAPP
jgi:hypothetical protein